MKIVLAFLLLFASSSFVFAQDCTCALTEADETTHYSGNQLITIIEKKSYRQLHGVALDHNGEPVENTLVEVFTNPEYLLLENRNVNSDLPEQKRIATCRTKADGKFCFSKLSAGKYELRLSNANGWNVTQIYVKVKPNGGKKRALEVWMSLGT